MSTKDKSKKKEKKKASEQNIIINNTTIIDNNNSDSDNIVTIAPQKIDQDSTSKDNIGTKLWKAVELLKSISAKKIKLCLFIFFLLIGILFFQTRTTLKNWYSDILQWMAQLAFWDSNNIMETQTYTSEIDNTNITSNEMKEVELGDKEQEDDYAPELTVEETEPILPTVNIKDNEVPVFDTWIDDIAAPTDLAYSTESQHINALIDYYNICLNERSSAVTKGQKMTKEYVEFVLSADSTFENYDDDSDVDYKNSVLYDATADRSSAKEQYRQSSNEQILANWYALCGKNYYEDEQKNKEFIYYNHAVDMYMDSYAVALAYGNPKSSTLDYITTCFLNIYLNEDIDKNIRYQALYSAAAFDNMYFDMLKRNDEHPNELSQFEHGALMDLGEIYSWLCIHVCDEPEDKLYYYDLAVNTFKKCPMYVGFGKKMASKVYGDLQYINQYCQDNIEEKDYPSGMTLETLRTEHRSYVEKEKQYQR